MILRQLQPPGISAFRSYLADLRRDPTLEVPRYLLDDERMTRIVTPEIMVEQRSFKTKEDAAIYLTDLLEPIEQDAVDNTGLWTWLSLFFFDAVCPPQDGQRKAKQDGCYVLEPRNNRVRYRHLLHICWRVYKAAGGHHRLFLGAAVHRRDSVTEAVMERLFVARIPRIFEVLDRLYWDPVRDRPRSRIASSEVRPGDLRHRLPIRIRQLERTYDLQSLSTNQLIELLGTEFTNHKQVETAARE